MSGTATLSRSISLPPSGVAEAIRAQRNTGDALFVWGPPGTAKSATGLKVATDLGIAFLDIRLSQMEPTDLRGIPFPIEENGVRGVKWSAPLTLPRDLSFIHTVSTEYAEPMLVTFANLNPMGTNNIRVCTEIDVHVTSVGRGGGEARIIDQSLIHVEVAIFDAEGNMIPGAVRITARGNAHAIIAFEEFNSAPPSVQAASYELILDRRLGDYRVPVGCYMVAMGNRETDRGVAYKIGPALMSRFVHVEMTVNFNEWLIWALANRLHPEVVGYLSAFNDKLFEYTPGTASRGFQCPRTWSFVSNTISKNEYLSESVELALLCGAIGEGGGINFQEFRKVAHQLPKKEHILSGALKRMETPPEVHVACALATTLCYELTEEHHAIKARHGRDYLATADRTRWLQRADNFLEFCMTNFTGKDGAAGPEVCVLAARAAIRVHDLPFDTKRMVHFKVFVDRYKDFLVG